MKLKNILQKLNENIETYFIQVLIKIDKNKSNSTQIYNEIRAIKDVVVVKVIQNSQLESYSDKDYDYALLEIKFINEDNTQYTVGKIKDNALKIFGLVKFFPRSKSLRKIRNY